MHTTAKGCVPCKWPEGFTRGSPVRQFVAVEVDEGQVSVGGQIRCGFIYGQVAQSVVSCLQKLQLWHMAYQRSKIRPRSHGRTNLQLFQIRERSTKLFDS